MQSNRNEFHCSRKKMNSTECIVTVMSDICPNLCGWFGEVIKHHVSKWHHWFSLRLTCIVFEAKILGTLALAFWKPLSQNHLGCASALKEWSWGCCKALTHSRVLSLKDCFCKTCLISFCFPITQMGNVQIHRNNVGLNVVKAVKQFQIFCKLLCKYEILQDNSGLDLTFVWS